MKKLTLRPYTRLNRALAVLSGKGSYGHVVKYVTGILLDSLVQLLGRSIELLRPSFLDLARMYDLVAKIPDGLVELKRLLETYIYNQGMEAIEKCCDASINVNQSSQVHLIL